MTMSGITKGLVLRLTPASLIHKCARLSDHGGCNQDGERDEDWEGDTVVEGKLKKRMKTGRGIKGNGVLA